jgi:hypothetical protein
METMATFKGNTAAGNFGDINIMVSFVKLEECIYKILSIYLTIVDRKLFGRNLTKNRRKK